MSNPRTWSSYAAVKASRRGDGIGYVLGDGIGALDLDHCLDRRGRLHPDAADLLAMLPATYTEVSQSGRGLHLIGYMTPGPGTVTAWRGLTIERYPRGRYLAITARRLPGTPLELADLDPVPWVDSERGPGGRAEPVTAPGGLT